MISRIVSFTDGSSALMCALLLALLSSILLLVSYVAGMYTKFRSIYDAARLVGSLDCVVVIFLLRVVVVELDMRLFIVCVCFYCCCCRKGDRD